MTTRRTLLAGLASLGAGSAAASPGDPAARRLDAEMRRALADGGVGGAIAVHRDGRPVFTRAYGWADLEDRTPVTQATVFKIASVTKSFTATLVLKLARQGRLQLDEPVSRRVPELPQAARLSVRQLLTQTSGLPDYAGDEAFNAARSMRRTPAQVLAAIAARKPELVFQPGTRWAYSNSNYQVLGVIAERAAARPLAALFAEELLRPACSTPPSTIPPRSCRTAPRALYSAALGPDPRAERGAPRR